jgi:hypothetical protein
LLSLYKLHSSWALLLFEMRALRSFETSEITHPMTLPHLPEDLNLQITRISAQSTVSGALRQQKCLHERVVLIWPPLILFVKKTFIVATETETPG